MCAKWDYCNVVLFVLSLACFFNCTIGWWMEFKLNFLPLSHLVCGDGDVCFLTEIARYLVLSMSKTQNATDTNTLTRIHFKKWAITFSFSPRLQIVLACENHRSACVRLALCLLSLFPLANARFSSIHTETRRETSMRSLFLYLNQIIFSVVQ